MNQKAFLQVTMKIPAANRAAAAKVYISQAIFGHYSWCCQQAIVSP